MRTPFNLLRIAPSGFSALAEPGLFVAIGLCIGVRVAFFLVYHLSFDANANMWQMQDVAWLRDRPVEAIYLMHMQPPLLNALYAVALQLPGKLGSIFLNALFLAASGAMIFLIYRHLRWSGLSPSLAAGLAGLFGVLPQTLLYENVFGYQHFEALLLLAAALLAGSYLDRGRLSAYAGFAGCVAALALLRSQYHVGWVLLVLLSIGALAARRFGWRWRHAATALAAVALVGGVYLKNYALFGTFSVSSWMGMTTAQMLTPFMAGDTADFPDLQRDIAARVQHGEFSPQMATAVARRNVWYGWLDSARDCETGPRPQPELCQLHRPSGMENFNHDEVLTYSPALGRDAFHLLRLYPVLYIDHLSASIITTLGTPSWDYRDLARRLGSYVDVWNALIGYTPGRALDQTGGTGNWVRSLGQLLTAGSVPLMIALVLVTGMVFTRAVREARFYCKARRRRRSGSSPRWRCCWCSPCRT